MEQISQFLSGERSYPKISGGTGPLVYPAAHVYIYTILYKITDEGRDILFAQGIFAGVYLVALGAVMACYRMANVCIFPLIIPHEFVMTFAYYFALLRVQKVRQVYILIFIYRSLLMSSQC